MKTAQLKKSLRMTWNWFRKSGVMKPADGSWGVAERVMLIEGNQAMESTMDNFPAWTICEDHCIIEQRRPDCNMETAFLFLQLHKLFGAEQPYRKTAENILEFLYRRSGLMNRAGIKENRLIGAWDWSSIKRKHDIWFDDESWMIFLALRIARAYPALDKKYQMTRFAMILADTLAADAPEHLAGRTVEGDFHWIGTIQLPHWGSLVCMALSEAWRVSPKKEYLDFIAAYQRFLTEKQDTFTTSEFGYAVIGATCAYRNTGDPESLAVAKLFADKICGAMNPETGSIPSEHYEAPSGKGLADTIYTMNWAALGLQCIAALDSKYRAPFEKIMDLLLKIQDRSRKPHLFGCWRGMYDIESGTWGGGDRFEGGANSIYTGWTNAPIALVCAFELLETSLMGKK